MAIGLVGRKRGMTTVFKEGGKAVAVTVIEALPNRVTQVKTPERDGYRAVQVAYGSRRQNLVTKPLAGIYAKAGVEPGAGLIEMRLGQGEGEDLKPGAKLTVELFAPGQKIDVTGTTIGKGFAGVIKRHHFSSQDATHGNSLTTRAPGSTGQRQTPGRVFKGKRMAGHLGNARRTVQNLTVLGVDKERALILVEGAVPGARGGEVLIRPAAKAARTKK